jgi:hypothetical protein
MHQVQLRKSAIVVNLLLGGLGMWTEAARADIVCLAAPHIEESIWLRDESGTPIGKELPSRTLGDRLGQKDDSRGKPIVHVALEDEQRFWVSAVVVTPIENCDHEENPAPPPSRSPRPERPEPTRPLPNPDDQSPDPFGCQTATDPDWCNLSALRDYARQGKSSLSYNEARAELFQFVDVIDDGGRKMVRSLYSDEEISAPSRGVPDPNRFNTEHVLPQMRLKRQSNFNESRTDLHHLFACASWINSIRGSMPFDEIANGEKVGASERTNSSFEPPERAKGIVARAALYVSMMYGVEIASKEEQTLRDWNRTYPVSSFERERSSRVAQVQGNHNPFVEHPSWVGLISNY